MSTAACSAGVHRCAPRTVLGLQLDPGAWGYSHLGSWQPVNLRNESSVTIDLSSYSFAGSEPASTGYSLDDAELADFLDATERGRRQGLPGHHRRALRRRAERLDARLSPVRIIPRGRGSPRPGIQPERCPLLRQPGGPAEVRGQRPDPPRPADSDKIARIMA